MKRIPAVTTKLLPMMAVIAVVASLAIISGLAEARLNPPAPAKQTISGLEWMSGDWQTTRDRAQIEEHWTKPAAVTMIGMGRTIVGDRTAEFEYLRLEQRGDEIYYVANPGARCPGADFKLTRLSGQEAMFENPQHDFPKRIIYRKNGEGSLLATVDGGEGTKAKALLTRG
ncbi:MAG: DUF6265 family protein [Pyrinomonadaceae bacterium]